jgi:hypothetical protein
MRLKLKKIILSLALLFIGFTLFGCVDEPYVEPVKDTFSVIRVVNLATNVPSMRVFIDDVQPVGSLNALTSPSTTEYFDIKPGKRNFTVYDENTNLIFNQVIEITSWERMTVVFAGYYSPDELQNTFGNFDLLQGEVYKSFAPAAGTANAYFVHGSADYDTLASRPYRVGSIQQETTENFGSVAFGEYLVADSLLPAEYNFYFASDEDSSTVTQSIGENLDYYFFLHGRPDNLEVFINEVVPPPARSRD